MKKAGMTLVECIAACCILAIISSAILSQYRSERILIVQQEKKTLEDSETALNNEFIVKGNDFSNDQKKHPATQVTPQYAMEDDRFYEQKPGVAYSKIIENTKNQGSAMVLGNRPTIYAQPIELERKPLSPPTISETLERTVKKFPVNSIFVFPERNPPGTWYRYTTDSTNPDKNSSRWIGNSCDTKSLPKVVRIAAFHPESRYTESGVVEITFNIPKINIKYHRTKDNTSSNLHQFTITEIKEHTNMIVLSVDELSDYTDIYYTIDDTPPTRDSILYTEPFHVFGPNCEKSKIVLKVIGFHRIDNFQDVKIKEERYVLTPKKIPLEKPEILIPSGNVLYKGNSILVQKENEEGKIEIKYSNGNIGVAEENTKKCVKIKF